MEATSLILTILMACICLYYFVLNKLLLFERLKIPHERPIPFVGNLIPYIFRRVSLVENINRVYKLFPNAKYFGFFDFMTPVYVIRDPELITAITIKNFDNFCDHCSFVNKDLDPLTGRNLFGMRGDHWRETRKLISPIFTSSKLKMMFELICQCADNFSNFVVSETKMSGKTYDIKELLSKYANDVVASCAFGISLDTFKNPNNEFYLLGRKSVTFDSKLTIKFMISRNFPLLAKIFRLKLFSVEVEQFFKEIVNSSVKVRDEKGIYRPDLIQLMMETRDTVKGPVFDIDEMTAHAFVFFLGGFDSVSTQMCFLAHEVGVNPDVQSKLRAEIDDVLKQTNGKPTYEAINGMKYLDAVTNECLRLYPLSTFLDRLCVEEFELPPATPDGEPITVKPGDNIWISNYSLHRDPKYFPEPDKFNPNRFLNGEVDHSPYMPFGMGPRICIANRFALVEIKIMLFYLLWRCNIEPAAETKVPIVIDKKTIFMSAEGGFWLKLQARQ